MLSALILASPAASPSYWLVVEPKSVEIDYLARTDLGAVSVRFDSPAPESLSVTIGGRALELERSVLAAAAALDRSSVRLASDEAGHDWYLLGSCFTSDSEPTGQLVVSLSGRSAGSIRIEGDCSDV